MRRYKDPLDPAMWGAKRLIGWVVGGIPLVVAHELLADLIPGYPGNGMTLVSFTGLYSARHLGSHPPIKIQIRRPGGDRLYLTFPCEQIENWLDNRYGDVWRAGFDRRGTGKQPVNQEPGTSQMTLQRINAQRDYEAAQARAIVSLPADRVPDVAPMLGAPDPALATPSEQTDPLPALLATAEIPLVAQPEPPRVPQYGDADYTCVPTFRILSCDDDGRPHHLGAQMEWVD